MDRFIAITFSTVPQKRQHLKSNMDRFIVTMEMGKNMVVQDLKSNMDRFIDFLVLRFHQVIII